jgi:hypothetical protein
MCNCKKEYPKCANKIGLFFLVIYILCFIWYFVNPAERELHLKLWQIMFLGFSGMNVLSFIYGAVQTYIWAYIVVGVWKLVCCCCGGCKKDAA